MNYLLKVQLIAVLIGVAGCAANYARDYTEMLYLRGDFSAWNNLEKYRVRNVGNGVYKSTVELAADGVPYELKFTDSNGLAGTNCGYLNQPDDQLLQISKKVRANCNAVFENFKFLPRQSGKYDFFIDFSDRTPQVWVEKAS